MRDSSELLKTFLVIRRFVQRPLSFCFKLLGQRKVATLASGEPNEMRHDCVETELSKLSPSRLLYVAEKGNKCNYLIDPGVAVAG